MKNFYLKSVVFWFVLLIVALINAVVRETTYKPFLTPFIGTWAHQLSSLTGITAFFIVIFYYLKNIKDKYSRRDLINVSLIWIFMTLIFECYMNLSVRHLTVVEVLQTYYFWRGETWIFVLLSLLVSPQIVYRMSKK